MRRLRSIPDECPPRRPVYDVLHVKSLVVLVKRLCSAGVSKSGGNSLDSTSLFLRLKPRPTRLCRRAGGAAEVLVSASSTKLSPSAGVGVPSSNSSLSDHRGGRCGVGRAVQPAARGEMLRGSRGGGTSAGRDGLRLGESVAVALLIAETTASAVGAFGSAGVASGGSGAAAATCVAVGTRVACSMAAMRCRCDATSVPCALPLERRESSTRPFSGLLLMSHELDAVLRRLPGRDALPPRLL